MHGSEPTRMGCMWVRLSTAAGHIHHHHLLWSPYVIGQTIIFSSCRLFFFLLFFFPRLMSAVADWMSAILPHMVWP